MQSDHPLTTMPLDAAYYIKHLNMVPHPEECGYFAIRHRAEFEVDTPGRRGPPRRASYSTIHFMICQPKPVNFLHVNGSDITHFWHAGEPIRYVLLDPTSEEITTVILGPHLHEGHVLQFTCPAGWWKAAELVKNDNAVYDFGLISEAVSPAFDYADNSLLREADIIRSHEHLLSELKSFLRPEGWIRPSPREPQADYLASKSS